MKGLMQWDVISKNTLAYPSENDNWNFWYLIEIPLKFHWKKGAKYQWKKEQFFIKISLKFHQNFTEILPLFHWKKGAKYHQISEKFN